MWVQSGAPCLRPYAAPFGTRAAFSALFDAPRPVFCKALAKRVECSGFDGGAHFAHQFQVVVQIVNGIELRAENFTGAMQMMQIAASEMAAGVARAGFVERAQ